MKKSNPLISCRNLWKTYRKGTRAEVNALRGVDIDIYRGDFIAIEGASGSGKSTLMNMIGCLDVPTKGKITIESKDISKLHEEELSKIRREKIGFVFQFFNLIHSLNALKNVELPMIFKGMPKEERIARSRKLLKDVGLADRMNSKPNELSGGERQRVSIARALANEPLIILADEPTGNLDSKTGKEIIGIFDELQKAGKTVIMITHDPNISKNSERVIRIKDGKITSDSR